jgi:hypothetical protein
VKVAQVVLVHDGQSARGRQPGREERLAVQFRALQHPHPRHCGHPLGAVRARRHDRGDV